jgi:hypothetical protein
MSHVAPHKWADAWRGKLRESEVAAMDRHAEGCARCAKARDRITRTSSQTFPAIKNQPTPEVGWDGVRARVHWTVSTEMRAKRARTQPSQRRRYPYVIAGAFGVAGIALGLGTGVASLAPPAPHVATAPQHVVPPSPVAAMPLAGLVSRVSGEVMIDGVRRTDLTELFGHALGPGDVIATGNGRIDVQFGDRSAFSLGPRSKLELRRFDGTEVQLVVDGTVDVEVAARAPGQRFLVEAGARTVEVRGTQFRVVHEGTEVRVACHHGLVAVHGGGGSDALVPADHKLESGKVSALPSDELAQLVAATPVTTPLWIDDLANRSSILEIASAQRGDVRVDGVELGQAPLRVRVMPGRHTVETAGPSGRFRRAGWVDAIAAQPARLEVAPDAAAPTSDSARRKELATGIAANRAHLARCTRAAAKSGISDLSVQIEISVDASGAVRFLNVDSDLTALTQACIHDALTQVPFGPGAAATWRERIDL